MKRNIFMLLIGITIFTSCAERKEETKIFNSLLSICKPSTFDTIGNSCFILLPLFDGCHSCEEKSITFFKENALSEELFLILSVKKQNLKRLNFFMNKEFPEPEMALYREKIMTESENFAFKNDMIFTFPVIYYAEDNEIQKKIELNASTIDAELIALKERFKR